MPRAQLLHLDRALRAHRAGVRVDPQRVRPASAGGGGRDPRPPAAEARGLRRDGLHRAQDRALRRPDGGHQARRDPDLPRPRLHHHRAPRRGERAGTACGEAWRTSPSCCSTGPAPCCTRSSTASSTTTCPRSPASARTSTRSRTRSSPATRTNAAERIYKLKREVLQFQHGVGPLVEPVDRLAARQVRVIHPEVRDLLPRRQRPPAARRTTSSRAIRDLLTSVLAGQPDPGRRAPERGHAQDLGLGGDRGRADADRRHLRHELRAHARAELGRSATRWRWS